MKVIQISYPTLLSEEEIEKLMIKRVQEAEVGDFIFRNTFAVNSNSEEELGEGAWFYGRVIKKELDTILLVRPRESGAISYSIFTKTDYYVWYYEEGSNEFKEAEKLFKKYNIDDLEIANLLIKEHNSKIIKKEIEKRNNYFKINNIY